MFLQAPVRSRFVDWNPSSIISHNCELKDPFYSGDRHTMHEEVGHASFNDYLPLAYLHHL